MNKEDLNQYTNKFIDHQDAIYLEASLEHQILELSRLVLAANNEKAILGINQAINGLREALNSLQGEN